jgi:uncharacterized DUF497 family protein
VDETIKVGEVVFAWDEAKAARNASQHRVSFSEATEAFFDPFMAYVGEDVRDDEIRETLIGLTVGWRLVLVVYTMRNDIIRIISARTVTNEERMRYEDQ